MTPTKTSDLACATCNNIFASPPQQDLIGIFRINEGDHKEESLKCSKILFAINGIGIISLGKTKKLKLAEGSLVLLPMGARISLSAQSNFFYCEFTLDETITTSDLVGNLPQNHAGKAVSAHPYSMAMNEKLWLFVTNTVEFMNDGLSCRCYQKMKIRELMHVMRVYYSPEMLNRFFQPMHSKIPRFAMQVYENWDKATNLDALADATGLSLSGFSKKFRRIFGISAYQWIMDKKGEGIINELCNGTKSIKQLTEEYDFYSVQHFGYYCKKRFGYSPGKIRQMSKKPASVGVVG